MENFLGRRVLAGIYARQGFLMLAKLRVPNPLPYKYRDWSLSWKCGIVKLNNRIVRMVKRKPIPDGIDGALVDGWAFTALDLPDYDFSLWAPDEFIDWTWFKQGRVFSIRHGRIVSSE